MNQDFYVELFFVDVVSDLCDLRRKLVVVAKLFTPDQLAASAVDAHAELWNKGQFDRFFVATVRGHHHHKPFCICAYQFPACPRSGRGLERRIEDR